jgi:hypothetical protein
MATEADREMEQGVGMHLLLEGSKKLTIGVDGLELNGVDIIKQTQGQAL